MPYLDWALYQTITLDYILADRVLKHHLAELWQVRRVGDAPGAPRRSALPERGWERRASQKQSLVSDGKNNFKMWEIMKNIWCFEIVNCNNWKATLRLWQRQNLIFAGLFRYQSMSFKIMDSDKMTNYLLTSLLLSSCKIGFCLCCRMVH